MDLGRTTLKTKTIMLKFPKTIASTVVLGDSQTKYLFEHFDPLRTGTPGFISQPGSVIQDMRPLLDFVPRTTTTLILHVGTNDLASGTGRSAFTRYRELLDFISRERPAIQRIYASLVLPRTTNRRHNYKNHSFVRRCNKEACSFNNLLRDFCRQSKKVFVVDHGFEWLPSARVFAADGLHPNFEGVALLASHIRRICFKARFDPSTSAWCSPAGETSFLPNPESFPTIAEASSIVSTAKRAPRGPSSPNLLPASKMPPVKPSSSKRPSSNQRPVIKPPSKEHPVTSNSQPLVREPSAEPMQEGPSTSSASQASQPPSPTNLAPRYNLRKDGAKAAASK